MFDSGEFFWMFVVYLVLVVGRGSLILREVIEDRMWLLAAIVGTLMFACTILMNAWAIAMFIQVMQVVK